MWIFSYLKTILFEKNVLFPLNFFGIFTEKSIAHINVNLFLNAHIYSIDPHVHLQESFHFLKSSNIR
jgi:hypothetical protein